MKHLLHDKPKPAEFQSLADQRASCKNEQVLSTWTYLISGEATTDTEDRTIDWIDLIIGSSADRSTAVKI